MSTIDETAPAASASSTESAVRPVWRVRALAVAIALAVNAVAWVVASVGGIALEVSYPDQPTAEVTIGMVLVSTLGGSALAWLARAVLDRIARRFAARIWIIGAAIVLAVSFVPVFSVEAATSTTVFLALLHVLLALVLFPVLGRRPAR
jgi:hypothetical protein